MSIDLTQLPPPDVLDYPNFEALLSERKAALIAACPEAIRATIAATLELESEPLTIDLEQSVYREYLLRERINTAVKATFLATATGADLDQFAAGRNMAQNHSSRRPRCHAASRSHTGKRCCLAPALPIVS